MTFSFAFVANRLRIWIYSLLLRITLLIILIASLAIACAWCCRWEVCFLLVRPKRTCSSLNSQAWIFFFQRCKGPGHSLTFADNKPYWDLMAFYKTPILFTSVGSCARYNARIAMHSIKSSYFASRPFKLFTNVWTLSSVFLVNFSINIRYNLNEFFSMGSSCARLLPMPQDCLFLLIHCIIDSCICHSKFLNSGGLSWLFSSFLLRSVVRHSLP